MSDRDNGRPVLGDLVGDEMATSPGAFELYADVIATKTAPIRRKALGDILDAILDAEPGDAIDAADAIANILAEVCAEAVNAGLEALPVGWHRR